MPWIDDAYTGHRQLLSVRGILDRQNSRTILLLLDVLHRFWLTLLW